MIIETLTLKNFRNYDELTCNFSPTINIFIGDNAQGKTNLIEAMYVLALARSHRANKDNEMIQWGKDFARIEGQVKTERSTFPLEIILSKKGKQAKLNHLEQSRLSTYIGHLNVIVFAPEDLDIVKGSPGVRRKFIDMELGQMSPVYLHYLSQYQRTLKQRNQYLKDIRYDQSQSALLYLDVLTEQLIEFGSAVLYERFQFTKSLERWAQPIHAEISQNQEDLEVTYKSTVQCREDSSREEIAEQYLKQLNEQRGRELEQGTTVIGPHRDDLKFTINGHDVHTYGSQGQQRTTALSLKLAEIDLMIELTNESPVLLLDDVLSELDSKRQSHLLQAMQGRVQTFLTTPSLSGVNQEWLKEPKIFQINKGQIVKEQEEHD